MSVRNGVGGGGGAGTQGPPGADGADGAPGTPGLPVSWEVWNPNKAYTGKEGVTRDGSGYVSLAASTNVDPATNVNPSTGVGTKWIRIAQKGDKGDDGSGDGVTVDPSNGVATIDDLAWALLPGTLSATRTLRLPVPYPGQLTAAYLAAGSAVAKDGANYWLMEAWVRRESDGSTGLIAAKRTQAGTGSGSEEIGEAITAGKTWAFTSVTFDTTNAFVQTLDVLELRFTRVGAPPNITDPGITVRVRPLQA